MEVFASIPDGIHLGTGRLQWDILFAPENLVTTTTGSVMMLLKYRLCLVSLLSFTFGLWLILHVDICE
jgi:hypothetical protein